MEATANKYINVLVTGASGFIGRKLAFSLAEMGYTVHALCRDPHHPFLIPHPNIHFMKGDILDPLSLEKAMQGCDFVYHTAALAKMWAADPNEFHVVNVTGTRNVMDCALKLGVTRVVYTSTCGVWGPTLNLPVSENDPRATGFTIDYERTKYLAELLIKDYVKKGLEVVVVNPSRVYGEGPVTGSNTVSKMIGGYLKGTWRFIPGNGQAVVNYVFLDDVVNGHIAAMEKGTNGERYILGGEDVCFNTFFDAVSAISGVKRKLFYLPIKLIKAYSHMEKLRSAVFSCAPFFLPEFADRLQFDQRYSSQKAVQELSYHITPFAEGLRKTVVHLQQETVTATPISF